VGLELYHLKGLEFELLNSWSLLSFFIDGFVSSDKDDEDTSIMLAVVDEDVGFFWFSFCNTPRFDLLPLLTDLAEWITSSNKRSLLLVDWPLSTNM